METHVKIVAILNLILSGMMLLAGLIIFVVLVSGGLLTQVRQKLPENWQKREMYHRNWLNTLSATIHIWDVVTEYTFKA